MKYLIIFLLILCGISFAQEITIKGKILDAENNDPLPNANILLKNNDKLGTAAEKDGSFVLSGRINKKDTLVISYIGYEKKTLPFVEYFF